MSWIASVSMTDVEDCAIVEMFTSHNLKKEKKLTLESQGLQRHGDLERQGQTKTVNRSTWDDASREGIRPVTSSGKVFEEKKSLHAGKDRWIFIHVQVGTTAKDCPYTVYGPAHTVTMQLPATWPAKSLVAVPSVYVRVRGASLSASQRTPGGAGKMSDTCPRTTAMTRRTIPNAPGRCRQ